MHFTAIHLVKYQLNDTLAKSHTRFRWNVFISNRNEVCCM